MRSTNRAKQHMVRMAYELRAPATKVVLIDGKRLAGLMIDFDVGVSTKATYQVKRLDSDYFNEE